MTIQRENNWVLFALIVFCIANFWFITFDLRKHSKIDQKLLKEKNNEIPDIIIEAAPKEKNLHSKWQMDVQSTLT